VPSDHSEEMSCRRIVLLMTSKEVRLATVLRELPFTISFSQRVLLFQNLIQRDKQEHQGDRVNFMQDPHIDLLVRRNYIYEDSFEELSRDNEPNLRQKMRVLSCQRCWA
jgi:ubiquitin-protein ligase E3 C